MQKKTTKIPNLTVHNNKIKIPKVALQHLQKSAYSTSYATTKTTITKITLTNKTVQSLTE